MAATPQKTPKEKLEELKKKLEEQDAELKQLTQLNKTYKEDFTTVDKLVKDFEKILDAYQKSLQRTQEEMAARVNYSKNKKPMIEVTVRDKLADIERVKTESNALVEKCRTDLDDLRTAKEKAKNAFDQAGNTLAEKIKLFDEAKLHQKPLEDNVKKLAVLQEAIEKEEGESKFAVMHYLMDDFIATQNLAQSAIITKDALEQKLNATWNVMDQALQDFRLKEAEKNNAEKSYDKKKEELKQLEDGLKEKILSGLAKISFKHPDKPNKTPSPDAEII